MTLVLDSLGDEEPEVADEAQRQVPRFEAVGVVRELTRAAGLRSKDEWVRLRAAEAFGRMGGPIEARLLSRAIDRRHAELSRTLLWSIERLERAGRLGGGGDKSVLRAVQRCLGTGVEDFVRAAALSALACLAPEVALERSIAILDAGARKNQRDVHEARCAALSVLVEIAGSDSGSGSEAIVFEHVEAALSDPCFSVRAHAARLVGRGHARKATLSVLTRRLEAETRPNIRLAAAKALGSATGQAHGAHVRSWVAAVSALAEDWRALPSPVPATGSGAEGGAAATPAGAGSTSGSNSGANSQGASGEQRTVAAARLGTLDALSDHLAILVDFSGSLWNERQDGTRRKDALDPEVDELLGSLDPETRFFLVPYTGRSHPFGDRPIAAGPREVRAAQAYFRKAKMRGQGNLWDAVQLALTHHEVDRILVVTDGAPTGGHRWDVDLMIDLLLEATRFRPITFDFVLEGTPRRLQRKWRRLTSATNGRLIVIEP